METLTFRRRGLWGRSRRAAAAAARRERPRRRGGARSGPRRSSAMRLVERLAVDHEVDGAGLRAGERRGLGAVDVGLR